MKYTYYAYTKKFDQILRAQKLADPANLPKLYRWLVKAPDRSHDRLIAQISNRLDRLINAPSMSVTLLLDNSGSMRGEKIVALARAAHLMELFEMWNVRVEVLGFTTRTWKGGQSRALWQEDGKPAEPGRLCDLRHIIYKTFEDSVSESSLGLGIMAEEGLLKEEVSGEALIWAYRRLVEERSRTKILFMFTDAMPVDDFRESDFLEHHFKSVVKQIAESGEIVLRLVGLGHDFRTISADAITDRPPLSGPAGMLV